MEEHGFSRVRAGFSFAFLYPLLRFFHVLSRLPSGFFAASSFLCFIRGFIQAFFAPHPPCLQASLFLAFALRSMRLPVSTGSAYQCVLTFPHSAAARLAALVDAPPLFASRARVPPLRFLGVRPRPPADCAACGRGSTHASSVRMR